VRAIVLFEIHSSLVSFGEEEGRISQGEEGTLDEGLSKNP
jgi:hypothetical protein